ncbi:MAG TPA: hypothetical protein ENJ82_11420, partial [Bacteroidetes bacterium]|nr:hypothetical protein [Bacteroidota bacterium]
MSRIAEIERLRSRMRQHHFVAISGPRNSGKSRICQQLKRSLEIEVKNMREIERRYKAKAGMKWKVAYIRLNREDNPFDLLTRAIAGPTSNILVGPNEKVDPLFESSIKTALKEGDGSGLLRIYQQFLKLKQYNFLVIVDQFENLFFTTILNQEDKHRFVRMLLSASHDRRQMYVTVAIRPPKADLWKQNFPNLNLAVNTCRYRLYNPNQLELEEAITLTFMEEKERSFSELSDEDLLHPEWLANQEIYQRVAVKRIREISETQFRTFRERWRKMYKEGGSGEARMVSPENVRNITGQLRGIVDVIWPQLFLQSNMGNLAEEDREDLVEDLKEQLTDVLTGELLKKLSRLLAEELYFEQEPLTQIERNVRQLMRDWAEVLKQMRKASGRRKRNVVTVSLQEQQENTVGAATYDYKVDMAAPMDERAEAAYEALRSILDKRIAAKVLTILGRNAHMGAGARPLSVDSLNHAMGRFASRLAEVLEVFAHSGILLTDPQGDITHGTLVALESEVLVERWDRMKEWVLGKAQAGDGEQGGGYSGGGAFHEPSQVSMDLVEEFGDDPDSASEYAERAEAIYSSLVPPVRKRAARHLMVNIAIMGRDGNPVNPTELMAKVGRFENQIREITEYFIRQGIIR